MLHPVGRYGSFGAGHGLIDGMRLRWSKTRTGKDSVVTIVEEPFLAGFEAADDGMRGRTKMSGRMARWGRVAASHMTALGAAAQVYPPAARLDALPAPGPAWRNFWVYPVTHVVFLLSPAARTTRSPL